MPWPVSDTYTTDNVSAGPDDPNAARSDLYVALGELIDIKAARGEAGGVASLNDAGLVPLDQLPFVPLTGDTVPIAKGGTAGTTAAEARSNLGLDTALMLLTNGKVIWGDEVDGNYFTFDGTNFALYKGGVAIQTW